MSHLNKVRKIKDSKKDPTKPDEFELILKREWDDRFASNKIIEKGEGKRHHDQNIKQKKDSKKHGKSGYKLYYDKNSSNFNNKNKLRINSNNIFLNNNIGGGENEGETISIFDDNKLRSIGSNNKNNNRSNNGEYNLIDNNNYLNLNISDNNSNYTNMSLNDINKIMIFFWDKLGVKDLFKKTFNELKEEMENDDAKKEFMIMEIKNLEIFDKFLQMLSKEIENRENQIHKLKRILNVIENQYIDLNLDIDDSILNEFYQTINNYRVKTIKVVESITFYNQLFYYFIYKGKFNEEFLMRKYKLLSNEGVYLLKIKNDLNFLGNSKINGYKQLKLNFNSNSDPFLLNVCEQIPINIKDYRMHIKQCQYLIMQGVIFNIINAGFDSHMNDSNTINNNNESIKNNNLDHIKTNNNSKVNNNSNSISNSNKLNINCKDKADNGNLKNNNNHVNVKENSLKRKREKIVLETQLIDKNDYDNFFQNKFQNEEQSEEQTLEELKKGFINLKILKRNKKDSNNRIEIDGGINELNNKNEDKKIRKIENNKEEENKEDNNEIQKKVKKNLLNEIIKENKEEEPKEDNKKEEIKEDNSNRKEEPKLYNEKEEIKENNKNKKEEPKENNKNEKMKENKFKSNEKIIIDSNSNNIKAEKERDLNEIKENNEKKEIKGNKEDVMNANININEEKNKINANNDNNLENSVISKKGVNSKEKSLSVTPRSKRGSRILSVNEINQKDNLQKDNNISNNPKPTINIHPIKDNDEISFYCGKISNFISIYSSYYNTIPEEQKTIFNLKSDPLEYLYNNFFPKIIMYTDKKTKNIKGLCILSHIYTSDSKNNGLFIEHISSYNEEERETIFEKLLSFIKENSYNIFGFENNRREKDIYIDLYYKFDNGKFNINTDIRDYFRNQLKFKWVKLENLSKFSRFQKMRHQFIISNGGNDTKDLLNNEYDDNNILNQSILGRKEFNNDDNNESEREEESEDDDNNIDISKVFDTPNDKEINESNKESLNINANSNVNANIKKEAHSHKICNLLNNFSIKNKTVLKFKNKFQNINKGNNVENIKYANPFNFIYLLGKIKESENINYDKVIPNIDIYFNESESNMINNLLSRCFNKNKTLLIEDNMYFSDIKELANEKKNKFKINTNINIFPIFDNCISFKYNNYYYNRIHQKKIQTFLEVQTQQTFYMINKTENLILFISSSLNDKFKQQYLNEENKENLSIKFKNIYNNLIDVKNKENKKGDILYIPSFEIKCKLENKCFANDKAEDGTDKYNLYCFEDYYNVKYLTEELMGVKYNKNVKKNKNINMNFEYDLINEKDVCKETFIKDDFLLVILNLNVIESLGSLPLLTLYIKKDNFISEQNI